MILCFCFTPFKFLSFALLSSVHQPVNAYFVDFIWCKVAGDFSYFPRKCYTPNLTLVWLFWPMISFFCVKFTVSCKKFFLQPWIRLLLILHHSLMEPLGMYEVSVSGVCVCVCVILCFGTRINVVLYDVDAFEMGFAFWRLYVNYECPFCQRVWIVRNYKVRSFTPS